MALLGYFDVFPDKVKTELRTATFECGDAGNPLPDGMFIFTEFFCTDPNCECQGVLVKVFHLELESACPEEVASISYSWNPNPDEVRSMTSLEMPNPFLDPFHRQASYASKLMDFWEGMIEHDKKYASRIRRHYDEIREEIGESAEKFDRRRSANHAARESPVRPLTKRERKIRKRRLARSRKR